MTLNPARLEVDRSRSQPVPLRLIRRRRTGYGHGVPPLRGLLPLVALLILWQLVQHGQSAYFPRPSLWWDAIRAQARTGALWPALGATMKSFLLALLLAMLIGTALGMAIGLSRFLDRMLGPLLDYCRFMPAAAVVPVTVLLAGYSVKMKLIVVVFSAVWPVLLQVRASVRSESPRMLDVARALHLTRLRTLWNVLLPSLVPSIVLGVRVAAPLVLIIVLLVEMITQVAGLGSLIATAQQSFDAPTAYGILAITGALAICINAVVTMLEAWLLRYRPRAD
jgi:ABC-type nitrate/sulfonate/bicarbonate transport system permease component